MNDIRTTLKNNITKTFLSICCIILFVVIVIAIMNYYNIIPKPYYTANDLGIKTIYSKIDFNDNKIDDYSDFVLGARKDAKNRPKYVDKYYDDAYPPDNEGVCTDVIWRAFKNAGYNLREMVDYDIKNNPEEYPKIKDRDSNIDFRRVSNLKIFFNRHAISLTIDTKETDKWQPGDIVIFENKHIGIISDKRNIKGVPFVLHNNGQLNREEDFLNKMKITAHYRFDASKINEEYLIKW